MINFRSIPGEYFQVRKCLAKFEQKRQTVEECRNHNNLLRRLMNEKASGNIPGIYGRLVCCLLYQMKCFLCFLRIKTPNNSYARAQNSVSLDFVVRMS